MPMSKVQYKPEEGVTNPARTGVVTFERSHDKIVFVNRRRSVPHCNVSEILI